MVEESRDLLAGQLERAQLEEEAVGGGHDASSAHTADPTAHASLIRRFLGRKRALKQPVIPLKSYIYCIKQVLTYPT